MAKIGSWDFTRHDGHDSQDKTGSWGDLDLHGATLTTEGLKVGNGNWARVRGYSGADFRERTLVAWIKINSFEPGYAVEQAAMMLKTIDGTKLIHGISLRDGNHYFLGRDRLEITEDRVGEIIQLAIVFSGTKAWQARTTVYRNGIELHRTGGTLEHTLYQSKNSEILFGGASSLSTLRIQSDPDPTVNLGSLDMTIVRAELYDEALDIAKNGSWDFRDGVANDAVGKWGPIELKGATLSGDGLRIQKGKWARTVGYTGKDFQDKTVVLWLKLHSLQGVSDEDGSAVSVHNVTASRHDSITFDHDKKNTWFAYSTNHRQESWGETTVDNVAASTETGTNKLVQMIAVYSDGGVDSNGNKLARVRLYRNGVELENFTQVALETMKPDNLELLFGPGYLSHPGSRPVGFFDATLVRMDLYGQAMDIGLLPDPDLPAEKVDPRPENSVVVQEADPPPVSVRGIVGSVYTSTPPKDTIRLFELEKGGATHITASEHDRDTQIGDSWSLTTNEMWVYPAQSEGLVPVHHFFDTHNSEDVYVSSRQDIDRYQASPFYTSYGTAFCALSPSVNKSNVAPLVHIYKAADKSHLYITDTNVLKTQIESLSSWTAPSISNVKLEAGTLLDRAFFGEHFGDLGHIIGDVLEVLDLRVATFTHEKVEEDTQWGGLLRDKNLVSDAVLDGFKQTTEVYKWKSTIKNIAQPATGPGIAVDVELKLFGVEGGAGAQLKITLTGEHRLDDVVPATLRKGESIPVLGAFLLKDPTLVFATSETLYEPSLDAGILAGFNLYANLAFDLTDGRKRPPVMELVSSITGVKNAAFHLGLGLEKTDVALASSLKVSMVAELALQWRQADVVGIAGGEAGSAVQGFAMPEFDTDYFAIRVPRSDIKITADLGAEGASVSFGFSTDLALEIEKIGSLMTEKAFLVFTGGATVGTGLELPGGDDSTADDPSLDLTLALTMNGTGRSTTGALDGTLANTTSLAIGDPVFLELEQAAVEFGFSVSGKSVTPKVFGVQAKGMFFDIEGEFAIKIDVDNPQAFVLIIDINEITLVQMIKMGAGVVTGTASNAIASVVPDSWIVKLEKILDVSIKDVLIYLVPVKNTIGGVVYEDTGLVIAGKLDLWGWQAKVYGVFDLEKGVALYAELDPISIRVNRFTVFSLGRSTNSVLHDGASLRERALTDTEPEFQSVGLKGPRAKFMLMNASTGANSLETKSDLELLVDARLTLLGISLDVFLSLKDGSFLFNTDLEAGGLTVNLAGSYLSADRNLALNGVAAAQVSAKGGVDAGWSPKIPTPFGDIELGRIGFTSGVDLTSYASSSNAYFSFHAYLDATIFGLSIHAEYKSEVYFDFEGLGDKLIQAVKDLITDVDPLAWFNAFKDGLVALGSLVLDQVFSALKTTAAAFSTALKTAGKAIEEVGDFLLDVGRLTQGGVAQALKAAGWAANQVGAFYKDVRHFAQESVAAALHFAGYGVSEVGTYLKDAYGLGAAALDGLLDGAGYTHDAIVVLFDHLGGEFATFFSGVGETLEGVGEALTKDGTRSPGWQRPSGTRF